MEDIMRKYLNERLAFEELRYESRSGRNTLAKIDLLKSIIEDLPDILNRKSDPKTWQGRG